MKNTDLDKTELKHNFLHSKVWHQVLDTENRILKNHEVYGKKILPGLAWIDLLYQWLLEVGISYKDFDLGDLSIHQPLIVSENQPITLVINAVKKDDFWEIVVSNYDINSMIYVTANMYKNTGVAFKKSVRINKILQKSHRTISLQEIYGQYQIKGVHHTGVMKTQGNAYLISDVTWIKISIADEKKDDYIFHPALIDAGAIVLNELLIQLGEKEQVLYLPIFLGHFKATAPFKEKIFVCIENRSLVKKGEIVTMAMTFFNTNGEKIGELTDLKSKFVRNEGSLNAFVNAPLHSQSLAISDRFYAIKMFLTTLIASILKTNPSFIDAAVGYYELGLDSLQLIHIVHAIQDYLGHDLSPTLLFENTTIDALAKFLSENYTWPLTIQQHQEKDLSNEKEKRIKQERPSETGIYTTHSRFRAAVPEHKITTPDIAVIGMSGRYPMAKNLEEFWQNLLQGKDCIREIPSQRWDKNYLANLKSPSGKPLSKWGGFIDDVACFDARFFRISAKEAENIDPQERLFLEVCWEAIEDAGYTPLNLVSKASENKKRAVGVFVGVMHKDYTILQAEAISRGEKVSLSLNYASIANRVSYFCDFHGPSMAIDTVCSSSLVAVHMAIESILRGESKVALAGGVNLSLYLGKYLTYGMMDMHASDGRCRAFGSGGDGYVSAEGVGALLLKPLNQAILDGDNIYAVIKGSSINHGGAASGLTVPSPVAQGEVILDSLKKANINPETISYIEAHGTGTLLGDPIEIEGLKRAFKHFTNRGQFCALGSVKSNIGHAESAAGISGLTKTILQLYHRTLVKSLHAETVNPYLKLENSPFYLQSQTQNWESPLEIPRRAGVSSFGASGTNAHIIVEEAPELEFPIDSKPYYLILLSAKTEAALKRREQDLLAWLLKENSDNASKITLSSIGYTLNIGRSHFNYRSAFVVKDKFFLLKQLELVIEGNDSECYFKGFLDKHRKSDDNPIYEKVLEATLSELQLSSVCDHDKYQKNLRTLGDFYVKGYDINWDLLHQDTVNRRVSLPAYSFEKEHYWIPCLENDANGSLPSIPNKEVWDGISYIAKWEASVEQYQKPLVDHQSILIVSCGDCYEFEKAILDHYKQKQILNVTSIRLAEKTLQISENEWLCDINAQNAFQLCLDNVTTIDCLYFIAISDDQLPSMSLKLLIDKQDINEIQLLRLIKHLKKHNKIQTSLDSYILTLDNYSIHPEQHTNPLNAGITGLAYSIAQSNHQILLRNIDLSTEDIQDLQAHRNLLALITDEPPSDRGEVVKIKSGKRYREKFFKLALDTMNLSGIRKQGVYLIVGGSGVVGQIMTCNLAEKYQANIIWIGRSPEDSPKIQDALKSFNKKLFYVQADVTSLDSMRQAIMRIKKKHANIHGAIFSGLIFDFENSIEQTTESEFKQILEIKTKGSLIFYTALKKEPLDFMCYFSSAQAYSFSGAAKLSAYATGITFSDGFVRSLQRNSIFPVGTINWGYWKSAVENVIKPIKNVGFIEDQEGFHCFETFVGHLRQKHMYQMLCFKESSGAKIGANFDQKTILTVDDINLPLNNIPVRDYQDNPSDFITINSSNSFLPSDFEALKQFVTTNILSSLSSTLKTKEERLDTDESFSDYGVDSILGAEFITHVNKVLSISMNPAVLFEHSSVARLVSYIVATYGNKIKIHSDDNALNFMTQKPQPQTLEVSNANRAQKKYIDPNETTKALYSEIAIIGMSGKFPNAENIGVFWDNLINHIDGVKELPSQYLNQEYYFSEVKQPGKSYCKWGGILEEYDCFDPLFFNLSPKDAELMSYHQRLILQESWKAIEDAGYSSGSFSGTQTGIFIGSEPSGYVDKSFVGSSDAIIASRLSYFLNLNGPAIVINTACSSSAVAIHLACESLQNKETDLALAGGVSVSLKQADLIRMSEIGMLSHKGKCYAFDEAADGTIMSEGVGVVLLKRLEDAIAAGDHIYGVICGSGINQDGASNGITAPNGLAQEDLITKIYQKFRINPEEITYIETHGTGTKLGDPVESNALLRVFQKFTEKQEFCVLGSAKAHIGHTAAAAGVIGLIKILLSIQNKKIPSLLHFSKLNHLINFDHSPFYINAQNVDWKCSNGNPRMAALNSFGHSGTNAHIVVRESFSEEAPQDKKPYYLITLSAKTEEAYEQRKKDLLAWLVERENNPSITEVSLSSISYTLNIGRDHYNYRGAWIVKDKDTLKELLGLSAKSKATDGCFQGVIDKHSIQEDDSIYKKVLKGLLEELKEGSQSATQYKDTLSALANLYVKGYDIEWALLYQGEMQQRISLPTYPFAKERYSVPNQQEAQQVSHLQPNEKQEYQSAQSLSDGAEESTLGFYQPRWEINALPTTTDKADRLRHLLVFADDINLVETMEQALKVAYSDLTVIQVQSGEHYKQIASNVYQVKPGDKRDYSSLFEDLKKRHVGVFWNHIVDLWSLSGALSDEVLEERLSRGTYHLLTLSQELLSNQVENLRLLHIYEYLAEQLSLEEMNNGFVRSLKEEHPGYFYQVVGVDTANWSGKALGQIVKNEFAEGRDPQVRYIGDARSVNRFVSINLPPVVSAAELAGTYLRQGGVYLITGGLGGLGVLFARYLAEHFKAKLVLTGRSALDDKRQSLLESIKSLGGEAIYIAGDIGLRKDVKHLIAKAQTTFGAINGIIHAAGVLQDGFVTNKTLAHMQSVFAPKIQGTLYLDELTRNNEQLDCFILFSSITSVLGNVGQSDYASANNFLDQFAYFRSGLEKQGKCYGRVISINWPLWAEGGMQIDETTKDILFNAFGMCLLDTKRALDLVTQVFQSHYTQVVPLFARQQQFLQRASYQYRSLGDLPNNFTLNLKQEVKSKLLLATQNKVTEAVADVTKLSPRKISLNIDLACYGFDSISFAELSNLLNVYYQSSFTPALFYQYPTIKVISEYLLKECMSSVMRYHDEIVPSVPGDITCQNETLISKLPSLRSSNITEEAQKVQFTNRPDLKYGMNASTDIAIIGIAGIFPDAPDVNTLWTNLVAGHDAITPFPEDRPELTPAKNWINWGGFIEDIDKFDPEFFDISPREAELMDPQQRIFLMTVCRSIEDAGYAIGDLSGQRCGLFAGVQLQEYGKLIEEYVEYDSYLGSGNSHCILVNRVSYLLNIAGPSEAIDTACSSSLVAIHRAVQSIQLGESDLAIAGGVHGLLGPGSFIGCAKAGMLSEDGRCKTFDKSANGYVRGEGVGAILLKPLNKAQADGDHIYGVIKGSAVNHGGYVNTLTAPNPNAQAELIKTACRKAGITPNTIGYIEAHGTGTSLGDPIEINGLKKAFIELAEAEGLALEEHYCGIGSIKTNIGHLETAAGIASIIKTLLALQHRKLPASLHCKDVNPYIKLEGSPFYIITELQEWKKLKDDLPRRAGISSFGFGGSNAHVIIEEAPECGLVIDTKPYYLITLSAKTEEAYEQRQKDLLAWLINRESNHAINEVSLSSISYTLNTGRDHYSYRGAWVVKSKKELKVQLGLLLNDKENSKSFIEAAHKKSLPDDQVIYERVLEEVLKELQAPEAVSDERYLKNLHILASFYNKGYAINFKLLHQEKTVQRVSLPTYPFMKKRCWVSTTSSLKGLEKNSQHASVIGSHISYPIDFFDEISLKKEENKVIILAAIQSKLIEAIASILQLDSTKIFLDENLTYYGFDSFTLTELAHYLSQYYNCSLKPTLFYEHSTIKTVSLYLLQNYSAEAIQCHNKLLSGTDSPEQLIASQNPIHLNTASKPIEKQSKREVLCKEDDIAVIGMATILPHADSKDMFWNNLIGGHDAISHFPEGRRELAGAKSLINWGGFVEDIDKFDPGFFNISPREAELMDPQQRIFLMTVCKSIEDAGYGIGELKDTRTSLFVGVGTQDYFELLTQVGEVGGYTLTGMAHSILPNRVSYLLGLKGSSEAIDTACSSSLVAIHRAVQSIQLGESDLAIAGGVNGLLSSSSFIGCAKAGMLSEDGRCKTFDKSANGYVRGEGVGAILLKPLNKAQADGDHIYGVIKGSAVNHGGQVTSLTAPNPKAQAELIKTACRKAGITPNTIGYIEAHGTGTSLGDPIEINGLKKAFIELAEEEGLALEEHYCGIGSVKTNIGHLETAAGIASIIKTLLALQHRKLPASLHCKDVNPYMELEGSPFYIITELQEWKKLKDDLPRRAGISSFGFGGSNAHVIIEEAPECGLVIDTKPYYLITLSAKTEKAYEQRQKDLLAWLINRESNHSINEVSLSSISYTLNTGRDHYSYRGAWVIKDKDALKELLHLGLSSKATEDCFKGITDKYSKPDDDSIYKKVLKGLLEELKEGSQNATQYKDTLSALANLYVKGYDIEWALLYQGEMQQRISLPTYPFAKERYWVPVPAFSAMSLTGKVAVERLHPLVTRNVSSLSEQCFETTLSNHAFYLQDHVMGEKHILPAVAYLEMARAAGALSLKEQSPIALEHVVWAEAIIVEKDEHLIHLGFYPKEAGVAFEVSSKHSEMTEAVVHSQGYLISSDHISLEKKVPDGFLAALSERCKNSLEHAEFYAQLKHANYCYGSSFQTVSWLKIGHNEALGQLQLLDESVNDSDRYAYVLHPSLLDGAIQLVLGLLLSQNGLPEQRVPFSLERIEIIRSIPDTCYVHIIEHKSSEGLDRYDLTLFGEDGEIYVDMVGLVLRAVTGVVIAEESTLGFYQPRWEINALPTTTDKADRLRHLLVFADDINLVETMEQALKVAYSDLTVIQVQSGEHYKQIASNVYQVKPGDKRDYSSLFEDLKKRHVGVFWNHIVDLWSLSGALSDEVLEERLSRGTYHLLTLSQELLSNQVENLRLLHIYEYLAEQLSLEEMNNGFVRSLKEEHPGYFYQVVGVDTANWSGKALGQIVKNEFAEGRDPQVRYIGDARSVNRFVSINLPPVVSAAELAGTHLRQGGVYLITGGLGGLGVLFARYLAEHFKAKLVLTGRSALDDKRQSLLESIKSLGGEAIYIPGDIGLRKDVKHLIAKAQTTFGAINGIIHAAGLPSKTFIRDESVVSIKNLSEAKVRGCYYLDELTKKLKIDFMVVFSSVSAYIMNTSLSAYASVNSFLDHFANYRNQLQVVGKRQGRTISINWSLWADGGMQIDAAAQKMLFTSFGMNLLSSEQGLDSFISILQSNYAQVMPIFGHQKRFSQKLLQIGERKADQSVYNLTDLSEGNQLDLSNNLQKKIIEAVESISKLNAAKISLDEDLAHYGFDSLALTELANYLNAYYNSELTPVLFYQYPTIKAVRGYLLKNYTSEIIQRHGRKLSPNYLDNPDKKYSPSQHPSKLRTFLTTSSKLRNEMSPNNDIAIIGIAGIFPDAPDVTTLWKNLVAEHDAITNFPGNRTELTPAKSLINWGGFIEDIDKFDPGFFNISPREAELMDPQQRIFLMTVCKSIEDAGYAIEGLSNERCGLFAGVQLQEYGKLIEQNGEFDGYIGTGNSHSILVNRVSYLLNLVGPSEAIDTACSSSLVAIHRAVQSIQLGESDLAIAGGVNGLLSSSSFIGCAKAGMLSEDGHCKTFDKSANGYVRGEGVGAILLKPLNKAQADGDHIYGVIKGSAVNHGGHVNTLTAPNPNAQAELIKTACRKAGITPNTIGYIEAHGTGTSLGDPIEINGLKKAFIELAEEEGLALEEHYCGIGSVKTNIGHLETAAGIASIIKTLLALQHRKLPASLHCKDVNPYIKLEGSPFYIITELQEWKKLKDDLPRRAGISSFGFGGSNAHVIIEEAPECGLVIDTKPYYLITLSAKTEEAYEQRQKDLLAWLINRESNHVINEVSLSSISYTLNTGRDHYSYRGAWVIKDKDALKELLHLSLSSKATEDCFKGITDKYSKPDDDSIYKKVLKGLLEELKEGSQNATQYKDTLSALANLYVKGYDIEWALLYQGEMQQRISLPTYPFAKERYWVPPIQNTNIGVSEKEDYSNARSSDQTSANLFSGQAECAYYIAENVVKSPLEHIDWNKSLQSYTSKHILIIYSIQEEFDKLFDLLSLLRPTMKSNGTLPLLIQGLKIANFPGKVLEKTPDFIFYLDTNREILNLKQPKHVPAPILELGQFLVKNITNTSIQIYYLYEGGLENQPLDSDTISSYLRSIITKHLQHSCKIITYYKKESPISKFQLLLQEWLVDALQEKMNFSEIYYHNLQRMVRQFKQDLIETDELIFQKIEYHLARWEEGFAINGSINVNEINKIISKNDFVRLSPTIIKKLHNLLFPTNTSASEGLADTPILLNIGAPNHKDLKQLIRDELMETLKLKSIDDAQSFQNYGLDSISSMRLANGLEKKLGQKIAPQWLIDFPTVSSLTKHLMSLEKLPSSQDKICLA